jgi:hypothetical protein
LYRDDILTSKPFLSLSPRLGTEPTRNFIRRVIIKFSSSSSHIFFPSA